MGHFYTPQAEPAHEGGLALARKEGNLPSVTTVTHMMEKPGLVSYYKRQAIMAALTLPRKPKEDDATFTERILQDADQDRAVAADTGTIIHEILKEWFNNGVWNARWLPEKYRSILDELYATVKQHAIAGDAEVSFADPIQGVGGQIDLLGVWKNKQPVVLDFKTQFAHERLASGKPKFTTYREWAMQLASYRRAVVNAGYNSWASAPCCNIIVSTNPDIPGIKIHTWPEEHKKNFDLTRGLKTFRALTDAYYAYHNLKTPEIGLDTIVKRQSTNKAA